MGLVFWMVIVVVFFEAQTWRETTPLSGPALLSMDQVLTAFRTQAAFPNLSNAQVPSFLPLLTSLHWKSKFRGHLLILEVRRSGGKRSAGPQRLGPWCLALPFPWVGFVGAF